MEKLFEILSNYNFWDKKKFDLGFVRQDYLHKILKFIDNKLIKVIVGQRRCGKSYILRQIIDFLVNKQNINPQNIFYFNKEFIGFEDIENATDLNNLFSYYKNRLEIKGKIYIFLDEVQNIEQWEKFVNSYSQDYTSDCEIFVTGSNSKLLSGELSTLLSGRYVEFTIYPFSFNEFSHYHKLKPTKQNYLNFIQTGGLPELVNFKNEEVSRNYVESLKNTIILRDIVARYSIKDVNLLESLFRFLASNIGSLTSFPNIVNFFKSLDKKTNYETISQYISYLQETFIFHEAERFDIRGKQTLGGVRKFYLNDLSYKNYLFGFLPKDTGYNLENQVYLELLQHDYKVYVGNWSSYEVDFVAQNGDETIYVQVTHLLTDKQVIDREFNNLLRIKDNYPKIVVSLDDMKFTNFQGIRHCRPWEMFEK